FWLTALTAGASSLTPGLSFTASTGDGASHPGDAAPDAMGAVGPDVIVSLTNDGYAVFRKGDGVQLASDTLYGFWTAAGAPPLSRGPLIRGSCTTPPAGASSPLPSGTTTLRPRDNCWLPCRSLRIRWMAGAVSGSTPTRPARDGPIYHCSGSTKRVST